MLAGIEKSWYARYGGLVWFHNSYQRQTVYIEKSMLFPKQFCSTRWDEDADVAQRVIHMWPHISISNRLENQHAHHTIL